MNKKNKNILIAGSNGNIGSYLYNELKTKFNVSATSKSGNDEQNNFNAIDFSSLESARSFAQNCKKIDVLIFLIGLAHKKGNKNDYSEFKKINFLTLKNLLDSLKINDKLPNMIIFTSTISIYGERYKTEIYDEKLEPNPFSPYAVTKLEAERYLLQNFKEFTWILRLAPVYSKDFMLNINRRVKLKGFFYKAGKGNNKISLCNINNIKKTIEEIIVGNNIDSGIYNLSDKKVYTYNYILKKMNAKYIFRIPKIFLQFIFILGTIINNIFLKENSVKLITNNIFTSKKLGDKINLDHNFN